MERNIEGTLKEQAQMLVRVKNEMLKCGTLDELRELRQVGHYVLWSTRNYKE